MLRLFRTRAFVFFVPPHGQNPPIHIYDSLSKPFMYDALLITFDLDLYCVKFEKLQQRLLFIYFSHHHSHTFTQLVGHHRGPTEPPIIPDAC
jgi:hypothetical protein